MNLEFKTADEVTAVMEMLKERLKRVTRLYADMFTSDGDSTRLRNNCESDIASMGQRLTELVSVREELKARERAARH